MKVYRYSLVKKSKYSLMVSIPREVYVENFKIAYRDQDSTTNRTVFLIYDKPKLILFFSKPNFLDTIEIKIIGNGLSQPGFIIPQKILFQIKPILFEGDLLFVTKDEENSSLIIHLDWNFDRIRSILQINRYQSIDQICQSFCSSQEIYQNVKEFIIDSLKSLENEGEITVNSSFVKYIA